MFGRTVPRGRRSAAITGTVAPVVLGCIAFALSPAASVAASSTVCRSETHVWDGTGSIGAGVDTLVTGVGVPAIAGTEVIAVGASADGVSADGLARAVTVLVGGQPVAAGVVIAGGEISLHHSGAEALTVTGASVVVERCHMVESATATAARIPAAADPGPRTRPGVASLPATGGPIGPMLGVAVAALAAGAAALRITRRQPQTPVCVST